jgi:hypothetical protein
MDFLCSLNIFNSIMSKKNFTLSRVRKNLQGIIVVHETFNFPSLSLFFFWLDSKIMILFSFILFTLF